MKGKGRPFTGINPTVIAVLTKTCERMIVPIPIKTRLENLSFDRYDLFMICEIIKPTVTRRLVS